MQPTEGETQAAMDAAARQVYDQERNEARANDVFMQPWDMLDQWTRNPYLDAVNPIVWAALKALPDRTQFITDVRRFLS